MSILRKVMWIVAIAGVVGGWMSLSLIDRSILSFQPPPTIPTGLASGQDFIHRHGPFQLPIKPAPQELEEALRGSLYGTTPRIPVGPPVPVPSSATVNSLAPVARAPSPSQSAAIAKLRWQSSKSDLVYRLDGADGTVEYLESSLLVPGARQAAKGLTLHATTGQHTLTQLGQLLQIDRPTREFALKSEVVDELGYVQLRYQQQWDGIDVWPGQIILQLLPTGDVHLLVGNYRSTPNGLRVEPKLSGVEALQVAFSGAEVEIAPNLIVHAPHGATPKLAYQAVVHPIGESAQEVFIDAHSGAILERLPTVCTAAVTSSGVDSKGITRSINLWRHTDNLYYAVDTSRAMYNSANSVPPFLSRLTGAIFVADANGATTATPNLLRQSRYVVSTSPSSGFSRSAVSLLYNLGIAYEYMRSRLGRNSFDNQGSTILGLINLGEDNAFYQSIGGSSGFVAFGDKFVGELDVVGHELGHGIVDYTADLIYNTGESGSMNEAFADIFGEMAESTMQTPNWQMGSGAALVRNLRTPNTVGNAPSRMSQYVVNPPSAHTNSTIISHAFYQLAAGLPDPLGILQAEQIFYRALKTKLNAAAGFLDLRRAAIQSAEELYGLGSRAATLTAAAFDAVEVFESFEPSTGTTTLPLTAISASDSALFGLQPTSGGGFRLARRETALGDGSTGVYWPNLSLAPFSRIEAAPDGGAAIYVTGNSDLGVFNTSEGTATFSNVPGRVAAVALDPLARFFAFVVRDSVTGVITNDIILVNTATQETKVISVEAPTTDESGATWQTVALVDAMDFSMNGEYLVVDALIEQDFGDGYPTMTWCLFQIETNTGKATLLLPPDRDVAIGNPRFGNVHPALLQLEIANNLTNTSSGVIFNLSTSQAKTTFPEQSSARSSAYPVFFGDDRAIGYIQHTYEWSWSAFSNIWVTRVLRQNLASDFVTVTGSPTTWLDGGWMAAGTVATTYRRGSYAGLPDVWIEAVTAQEEEGPGRGIVFNIRRSFASPNNGVQFRFYGSALPSLDYTVSQSSYTFATGSTLRQIFLPLVDDSVEELDESLFVELMEAPYFVRGADWASVVIKDDDRPSFSRWAQQKGVSGTLSDPDHDGLPNLVEYALGGEPLLAARGRPTATERVSVGGEHYLQIRLNRSRRLPDVAISVQCSANMIDWLSAGTTVQVIEDSETALVVRETLPMSGQLRRALRFVIAQP